MDFELRFKFRYPIRKLDPKSNCNSYIPFTFLIQLKTYGFLPVIGSYPPFCTSKTHLQTWLCCFNFFFLCSCSVVRQSKSPKRSNLLLFFLPKDPTEIELMIRLSLVNTMNYRRANPLGLNALTSNVTQRSAPVNTVH